MTNREFSLAMAIRHAFFSGVGYADTAMISEEDQQKFADYDPPKSYYSILEAIREDRKALIDLRDAFLSRHGCFPLDRVTDEQRQWNDAMIQAHKIVGDRTK